MKRAVRIIFISLSCLALIFAITFTLKLFLLRDSSYAVYEKSIDEHISFEVNAELVDPFYRHSRLRPDHPDIEFITIASFSIDLDNNHIEDSIILRRLVGWENDPGDFHQITIITDSGAEFTETNFDGWVRINNNYYIPDSLKAINQIETDHMLITDFYSAKVIGLFGWVYGAESGFLTIIDFSKRIPRIMVNKKFELIWMDKDKILVKNSKGKCRIECIDKKVIMTCK